MKPEIHPQYKDATITCACGSSVVTHSTAGSFSVDICSQCHPFYTGKQRIADTAGRVERFKRRYGRADAAAAAPAEAPTAEAPKAE
jgi:large subunit ribosomal protein L31